MSELTPEAILMWSVGLTVAASLITIADLRLPLRKLLESVGFPPEGAGFGLANSNVVLVLLPLACLMTGPYVSHAKGPPLQIFMLIQWSLVGLLLAVFIVFSMTMVAISVMKSERNSAFNEEQVANIHRLLLKLEEYRARDILKHPHAG